MFSLTRLFACLALISSNTPLRAEEPEAGKVPDPDSVVNNLDDVVVVATRTEQRWLDTAGTVTRVDRETLLETGVQDLGGIVKYDPTVVVPFDMTTGDGAVAYGATGAASFNIRGTEGNRVGLEVDGIRQPPEYVSTSFDAGAETGAGGMGRDYFDPSMFQLVEILKGGASALYGSDALGGMVSMKTLEAADLLGDKDWGGLARTQYFSRNRGFAWQEGGAWRKGNFDFMLLHAGREGEETGNNGYTPPDPLEMHSNAWLAKAGYTMGDHRFLLTYENYERDVYANMRSALHPSIAMFSIFKKSIENWQDIERQRASLNWDWNPQGAWIDALETHVYWQDSGTGSRNLSRNPPRATGFPEEWGIDQTQGRNRRQQIDFRTEIYGLTSIARKEADLFGMNHHFLAGLDISQENSSNHFDRVETDGLVIPNPGGGLPTVGTQRTVSDRISFAPAETYRLGFFLQDEIKPAERWTVTPGLRVDYHEIAVDLNTQYLDRLSNLLGTGIQPSEGYDNFSISPRLDAVFATTEHTRVYAGYGMGIRNPTAEELTMVFDHPSGGFQQVTVPNPDLKEEVSHAFKVGYKGEGEAGRFAVEGFFTKYDDFIENNVPVGFLPDGTALSTTKNMGEAIIYGIEASGEWEIGSKFKRMDGWALGLNTGRAYGENQTKDTAINTVEPWKTVGWIGYRDPGGVYGARLLGTYTAAVTRTDDTTMNGRMFRPPSWFTLDAVAWWKPMEGLTVNGGVNNILDEEYYEWGTVRRSGGHMGLDTFGGQAGSVTDRSTAPGTNVFLSATYAF
ncbi:TonB-dependent hemoglobin/transferrin/lactoferrin family receptor [Luteolibacter sp. Populi]|uniref:TonB-dependent hemoglobin/transferrin/lactoferrin family receptor n=1 Tax=Luteolibacter sp. Populi TaxID=3230487 RepID=UPI003467EA0E